MKEIKNELVKEFKAEKGNNIFYVYIFDKDNAWEVYLQKELYGIISLMFGFPKDQTTLEQTIAITKYNLDEYMLNYELEYCEEEEE